MVISFVIALVSMIREKGKVPRETVWQASANGRVSNAGQTFVPVVSDIAQKPEPDGVQTQTPVEKTGPTRWVSGDQPSGVLHPKYTTTIGMGLRTNLNNSVSIRDLKKKEG